jgi:hypothetical protein
MLSLVILIFFLLLGRFVEVWFFIKFVSKLCHSYDIWYVDKPGNEELAVLMIRKPTEYFLNPENHWSAYRFVFFSGPNLWGMFFHPGFLSLENIYGKHVIQKLNDKDVLK